MNFIDFLSILLIFHLFQSLVIKWFIKYTIWFKGDYTSRSGILLVL